MGIKDRRRALGWRRAELARRASVDPRTLQLIEFGDSLDDESIARVRKVLDIAESGDLDGAQVAAPPRPDHGV